LGLGAEFVNPDKHVHGIPLPWPHVTVHVQRSFGYLDARRLGCRRRL
jgi:hypothetical protein